MKTLTFFAPGIPKGQPRGRACIRGRHAGIYDPGTADNWKASIRHAALSEWDKMMFTGPVRVSWTAYFPRPKSHNFTGKRSHELRPEAPTYHTAKPDRDNLDKAILDALTNAGIWNDDAQVCCGEVCKCYSCGTHGVNITITQMNA